MLTAYAQFDIKIWTGATAYPRSIETRAVTERHNGSKVYSQATDSFISFFKSAFLNNVHKTWIVQGKDPVSDCISTQLLKSSQFQSFIKCFINIYLHPTCFMGH